MYLGDIEMALYLILAAACVVAVVASAGVWFAARGMFRFFKARKAAPK